MFRIAIIIVLLILLWDVKTAEASVRKIENSGKSHAHKVDLTIGGGTDGGDLDIVQDGEDNNIDLDITSMDNFISIIFTGRHRS